MRGSGPLARLRPHLAEREPSEGGNWVGRDPRRISTTDWQATGLRSRTLAEAVRAKCLDCCGGQLREVRFCMALTCPLWPFRMGTDPHRGMRGGRPKMTRLLPISDPSGEASEPCSETTAPG